MTPYSTTKLYSRQGLPAESRNGCLAVFFSNELLTLTFAWSFDRHVI